jgi:DNA-directed RNA polymerase subunit delta
MSNTVSTPLDKKMSEVDLAFHILKEKAQPTYYRTLIEEVFAVKPYSGDEVLAIASVHTQINLDTRFIYLGQGQWGLKFWVPTKSHKKIPSITLLNRSVVYDDQNQPVEAGEHGEYGFILDEENDNQDSWDE